MNTLSFRPDGISRPDVPIIKGHIDSHFRFTLTVKYVLCQLDFDFDLNKARKYCVVIFEQLHIVELVSALVYDVFEILALPRHNSIQLCCEVNRTIFYNKILHVNLLDLFKILFVYIDH
jgi:hypothetical protein